MAQKMALSALIIEGRRGDHSSFAEELGEKGYLVTKTTSGSAGLKVLDSVNPDIVIIDAASLRTSGVRICQSFRKTDNDLPIILIVDNNTSLPEIVDANLVLRLPFTVQKLYNRTQAYRQTADKFVVQVGPIALNTKTQLVTCNDRQTKLTPRLVEILKMLMRNKGKVVKREPLFSKVWKTDYTGDTRTLDVHISWLRQAIEEDPHHPKLIRTVRGEGYILEV
ncbi:MAG: response regulator transcription factor [Chloroflexota bacterium]|nr:response regulator transcription factor [Chloroflexota bacterium]